MGSEGISRNQKDLTVRQCHIPTTCRPTDDTYVVSSKEQKYDYVLGIWGKKKIGGIKEKNEEISQTSQSLWNALNKFHKTWYRYGHGDSD